MFETIIDRTAPIVDTAADRTRNATVMLADAVARTNRPIDLAVKSSLRLNNIAHTNVARLVKQQARMIESTVDAASKRLHVAADAASLRDLVNDQVAMIPASRKRLMADARKTVAVFVNTSEDLAELMRDTLDEARSGADEIQETVTAAKKTATRKARTVRRNAGKTAKKVSSKARAVSKKKVSRAKTR